MAKKLNEHDLSNLLDHILTSNLQLVSKLAMIRKMVKEHEKYY